ncbi:MAG: alpha/beta fold hydrolase [Desulfatibacillaceae bacterium]
MPFLAIGDENIHYTDNEGPRRGACVLVHGSGGSTQAWPAELRNLGCTGVVAVDLPGHGRSEGRGRNQVASYVEVVDALVRELGLSDVALFGHSLGSAVALTVALDKSGWLGRLVLVGAGARLRVLPAILEGILNDFDAAVEQTGRSACAPGAPDEAVAALRESMRAAGPEVTHGDFAACDNFDVMDRLGEITVPVLVIAGDKDILTPVKYAKFLADGLPGSRMVVMENAGHFMAMEKPVEFVETVRPFVCPE